MPKQSREQIITNLIIIISVVGALYFGYNAIKSDQESEQPNPFEYDLDQFSQVNPDLIHFRQIEQIPTGMTRAYGIAVSKDNRLYISGRNRLHIFSTNLTLADSVQIPGTGYCIAADSKGNIYIGVGKEILVCDPSGNIVTKFGLDGEHPLTTSLAATDEYLYVADAGGHIVWQLTHDGQVMRRIGAKDEQKDIPGFIIPSPFFDLAVDPDGFLWVANPGRHSLENYTADGDLRTAWGKYGIEIESFCGCCNPSHIAIMADGSFVTSEKGIARVKIYNRIGELTSVVAAPASFDEGTTGIDLALDSKQNIYLLDNKRNQVRIFGAKDQE